jgi:hypothetical protein
MKHVVSAGVCKFAALLLMFALPAVASAPVFTVNPAAPFVQPAGPGGCSFDVSVVPQAGRPNNGKIITFATGSQVINGAVFETLTNLTNFKSINLNISGPGQFSVSDNTITLFGPQLLFGFENLGPAVLPSVAFIQGKTVLQLDNTGHFTSVSRTGAAPQDVCQSLE